MEENTEFKELYERFKSSLSTGDSSHYFDENELIDVFDYAGDLKDDYVRLEAIELGLRLFPGSYPIKFRKAIYLSDINIEAFKAYMQQLPNDGSVMWRILYAKAFYLSTGEPENILANIVRDFRFEEDEEIIQFVALAAYMNNIRWIVDNIEVVKKKCAYQDTLLYEVARECDSADLLEYGVTFLEELTFNDPFNIEFWTLLGDYQLSLGLTNDAVASSELALAICPDDITALTIRALSNQSNGELEKALKDYEKVLQIMPDSPHATLNLARIFKAIGKTAEAESLFRHLFDEFTADSEYLMEMLYLSPKDVESILERFYNASEEVNEDEMLRRVTSLAFSGHHEMASRYIGWFNKKFGLTQSAKYIYIELLYMNEEYKAALDFINAHFKDVTIQPSEFAILPILASVHLINGEYKATLEFCNQWLGELEHVIYPNITYSILATGVKVKLRAIRELLVNSSHPSEEEIKAVTV